ncbi:excisionase family DNA-binding protein [Peribacillus kribbensis]|uniref:excisionase family DNA-binding protein n=1 Tax=Peribacillus kribbensis TaxID=356658 RepID=UPI000416F28D|nr:excisionase family DNA-binding protein [Peribacillus kribbensis]
MYLTIEETAEYLSLPAHYVESLVMQKKIRAVHDGKQYLINKEQFATHFEQMEKYKSLFAEWQNESIPEDMDVKDED